ncbi:MAG: site-specific integrase [Armatimonadota bacterium]
MSSAEKGVSLLSEKIFVIDYWHQWVDFRLENKKIKPKTAIRYKQYIENNLAPLTSNMALDQIQPVHIDLWISDLIEKGGVNGTKLSSKTVFDIYCMIRASFNQAVKWRKLAFNPALFVDPPIVEKSERMITDRAGIAQIIEAVSNTKYRIPVLIAISTGMRRAEIAGLRWEDFIEDEDQSRFIVRRNLQLISGQLVEGTTKTRKSRIAPAPPSLVAILKEHRKWQEEQAAESPNGFQNDGWICTHPNGKPFSPDSLSHAFYHIAKHAKLTGLTLHGLRHTLGTEELNNGVAEAIVAGMLGHNVKILREIYYHSRSSAQNQARNVAEQLLNPPAKPQIRIVEWPSIDSGDGEAKAL